MTQKKRWGIILLKTGWRSCPVFLLTGFILLSGGCGSEPAPVDTGSAVRPVKMVTIGTEDTSPTLKFPALIRARNTVDLAFDIPGRIQENNVRVGQKIEAGTLLASLDDAEYKARLAEARTAYQTAAQELRRFETLLTSGAVTASAVDQKRAVFASAEATLAVAEENLRKTKIHAPFDGVVAQRFVDSFSSVQAKQPVFRFQALTPLDVVIDVPEPTMLRAPRDRAEPEAHVVFEALPGVELPVSFLEVSTEADPQTQTFEVVFALEDADGLTVLPGMTATLVVKVRGGDGKSPVILPPLAVVTSGQNDASVWVYDPETGQVNPRAVQVGPISEAGIEITEGLAAGDTVVVAGMSELEPGMTVRPLQ